MDKEVIESANKISKSWRGPIATDDFIREMGKEFTRRQIENFPRYCYEARKANWEKKQWLQKYGKKGKFTDTYGWSENGEFKVDYDIPQQLYLFMQNLVDPMFWTNENEKTWRRFMKRICRGDDPQQILVTVNRGTDGTDDSESSKA